MTERIEADRPARSEPDEPAATAGPLACAYSPSWLSGPSHYEGLVATFLPDPDEGTSDDPSGGVPPGGSPA